jgi:hypothetical protein
MIVLLIPLAVLVASLLWHVGLPAYRRRRMTAELRREWWPRFERELREYMSQTWQAAREAERRA